MWKNLKKEDWGGGVWKFNDIFAFIGRIYTRDELSIWDELTIWNE